MSTPAIYTGQSKVEQAGRWEKFTLGMKRWASAKVRELTIDSRLDVSGGFRFLRNIGQTDKTERTAKTKRGRLPAVETLRLMYKGENDWGNQLTGVITDFNASMQWGNGVRVKPSTRWLADRSGQDNTPDPPELQPWQDFLDFNDLNDEGGIDLGVSGELDGQALLTWERDERERNVRMWTVPLLETKYQVEYERLWQPSKAILNPGDEDEQPLKPGEFVFAKLRALGNGTYGVPTCKRIIDDIIDLDKARTDFRKINNLFASPTPLFKAGGEDGIDRIWDTIKATNWRIGKAFILMADDSFELVTLDPAAVDSLLKEIVMLLQLISAASSVPVHFLGHPDLMSNRAVAQEDMKPSVIFAGKAQKRFVGTLNELAEKVLPMLSQVHGTQYDARNITHSFPHPASDVEGTLAAWLPARLAKQISHETFLNKVGIDDADGEMQKLLDEIAAQGVPEDDLEAQAAEGRVLEVIQRASESEVA